MSLTKFFKFLTPKDKLFFPLFECGADNLVECAILLNKLFLVSEQSEKTSIMMRIKELEQKGDETTHTIFEELNKSFITPFDREDIHKLASSLDDVLDFINSSSQRIRYYKPKTLGNEFIELSELILQASREIHIAIFELKNLKKAYKIKDACIRINEIENQADDIYYHSLSQLYNNENDAIEVIKKKEILTALEEATDMAEDVADVLKSIIVKNA
ncbi:MAG: phosphate transport regulator [Bacteroidetes bacterium GWA2_31_9]|nr:MAG: phosphate transport regulator [Bacteroidetes bacterium GWA2_31_9]